VMPGNHSRCFDNEDIGPPFAPNEGKPNPQDSIRSGQLRPFHRPLQHTDLMTQRGFLLGAQPARGMMPRESRIEPKVQASMRTEGTRANLNFINDVEVCENHKRLGGLLKFYQRAA
jgi:hypothetical protein